jgi:hypothetical protein
VSNCLKTNRRVFALALLCSACGSSDKDAAASPMNLATAGNGGSSEAAGAGGAAADGGVPANPDDMGNHFASGDWHGYFWTSTQGEGTNITPMNFSEQSGGMPRCVHGSVAMTSDHSGVAILGVNLNEDGDGKKPVTPTHDGVLTDIQNKAGTALLFQVEGELDGKSTRWCAQLKESGGFIPWKKLNTACWDNSGKAYDNEPIMSAALVVPGSTDSSVMFDFCLKTLAEVDAP